MEWQPIETAPKDTFMMCGHREDKWIRFGRYLTGFDQWYYSGTNERSQYTQIQGGTPTHWMPLPEPPKET